VLLVRKTWVMFKVGVELENEVARMEVVRKAKMRRIMF
jgi:hypothetical protein